MGNFLFQELSEYAKNTANTGRYDVFLRVGWLSPGFLTAEDERIDDKTAQEVLTRMNLIYSNRMYKFFANIERGIIPCKICNRVVSYESDQGLCVEVGHSELWIPFNNTIYISPDIVEHYIRRHKYKPPKEYIDAILNLDVNLNFDAESVLASMF